MKELNLPEYSFRIIREGGSEKIFDSIRKKYVKHTPEERVRQYFVRYLVNEGKYPEGLIGIEVMSGYNKLRKRVDILVHNRKGQPVMIVECKAPSVTLTEEVFDQAVCYNMGFKVPYLIVTNGIHHFACKIDHEKNDFEYLLVIPLYDEISGL